MAEALEKMEVDITETRLLEALVQGAHRLALQSCRILRAADQIERHVSRYGGEIGRVLGEECALDEVAP